MIWRQKYVNDVFQDYKDSVWSSRTNKGNHVQGQEFLKKAVFLLDKL
jgi:hypothetical protein